MSTKNLFIPSFWGGGGIFVTASLFAVSFIQSPFCDPQRARQKSFPREGQARAARYSLSPREALPTEAGGRAALRNSCCRRNPFCIAALEARRQFESQMRDSPLELGEVEGSSPSAFIWKKGRRPSLFAPSEAYPDEQVWRMRGLKETLWNLTEKIKLATALRLLPQAGRAMRQLQGDKFITETSATAILGGGGETRRRGCSGDLLVGLLCRLQRFRSSPLPPQPSSQKQEGKTKPAQCCSAQTSSRAAWPERRAGFSLFPSALPGTAVQPRG